MQIYMITQHFLDILDENSKNKKRAFDPLILKYAVKPPSQIPLRPFIALSFTSYLMQCTLEHDTKAGG